ncbi:hypothetical protein PN419_05420 [Halorubrum ezzemoulense]|uniref:DUF7114 family protein n=1 Tax=Halorubrum ezzemoulense TaxID=337243 RepID=UPI00232F4223|nr:hypothetical protein [Halorubrum ezzemoulense]MDB9248449.1 hypothetical protein [Halorubrum ezzemoulense]MDB9259213.1 hypothetical protein [Halorubrum ezzemoulense]MDB9262208.1 hypothetical protein [Halorubrum ezzemoulense]MDB9266232.1 hypothetical protein [Halorubrum ezzemoulense]MDB9269574.1 hypothetical protein [Halorubrum ezzemoulense]
MDDAARARDAAREALADVEPEQLREALDARIGEAAVTPGVLALVTARALDPDVELGDVTDRAAGVQLIYEGLRLTRTVAREEPWVTAPTAADIDADMDILAADVLVSRGFSLLACTDAAGPAVDVVRAFGRDQTLRDREGTDAETAVGLDRNLEVDALELAVVAGTTAVGGDPPEELLAYARDLAADCDGEFPPAGRALPETTADRIADISDRAVSATDR